MTIFDPLRSTEGPRNGLKFGDCVPAHDMPVIGSVRISVNVGSERRHGLLIKFAEVSPT